MEERKKRRYFELFSSVKNGPKPSTLNPDPKPQTQAGLESAMAYGLLSVMAILVRIGLINDAKVANMPTLPYPAPPYSALH